MKITKQKKKLGGGLVVKPDAESPPGTIRSE